MKRTLLINEQSDSDVNTEGVNPGTNADHRVMTGLALTKKERSYISLGSELMAMLIPDSSKC